MNSRFALSIVLVFLSLTPPAGAQGIRIGIIGCDTSHVTAFTQLINDSSHPKHVPGGRVVAAFKGGSDDIESSYGRVDRFARQLQDEFGVTIVDSIEALCKMVDAVLLESVDGRPHLEQIWPVVDAGLPVFVDKPMAGSLADVLAIFDLTAARGVPCFSASSYRFYESLRKFSAAKIGEIRGAISYGPAHLEPTHPDLFWYGVHPVEALFTVLGAGCKSVVRTSTENTDVVTGVWEDGRVGTLVGLRNQATPHQVTVFGTKAIWQQKGGGDYAPLVREIMQFFKTGREPISRVETIEIFAFMEAADESKRRGGVPVELREVLRVARASVAKEGR